MAEFAAPPFKEARHAPVAAPADRPVGRAREEPPRVLIVEDEYLLAVEIESTLEDAGFAVVGVAATAAEAVEMAKAERPALIVMDIRLPGRRDGVDAAIEIYRVTGIRSIFATAYAEPQMRQRAEAAAPLGWLPKPYRADALIPLIRDALKQLKE